MKWIARAQVRGKGSTGRGCLFYIRQRRPETDPYFKSDEPLWYPMRWSVKEPMGWSAPERRAAAWVTA